MNPAERGISVAGTKEGGGRCVAAARARAGAKVGAVGASGARGAGGAAHAGTPAASPIAVELGLDDRSQPTSHLREDVRRASEVTLGLAEHLGRPDRALVRGVYDRGLSAADIARAAGAPPRRLQRRLNVVMDRLASAAYRQVLAQGGDWPAARRRIATAVIVHGLSQRDAASQLKLSLHTVRRELARIRAMLDAREKRNNRGDTEG